MEKYFIITIDTEGDNLWAWHPGQEIHTENTRYLPRFQELSNKYGFYPTWLTNYEMIMDDRYVSFIRDVVKNQLGEVGMHLHAWNNPPIYELQVAYDAASYLFEYPREMMDAKIDTMTKLIIERVGVQPVSHRSGRWATNEIYFEILKKYGYEVDCSVTPHVNWSRDVGQTAGSAGSNYKDYREIPYQIHDGLWEVPVTIRPSNRFFVPGELSGKGILRSCYHVVKKQNLWLRPNGRNLHEMKYLVKSIRDSQDEYLMFMLHSSEMMPGGSPTFQTEDSIEKMYQDVERVFSYARELGYKGITLQGYLNKIR